MGVDCLALMMVASHNKQKTESLIMKELGVQSDSRAKKAREDQLFENILSRVA